MDRRSLVARASLATLYGFFIGMVVTRIMCPS